MALPNTTPEPPSGRGVAEDFMSACIRIVSSAAAFVAGVVFGVQPSYAQEKQARAKEPRAIASTE